MARLADSFSYIVKRLLPFFLFFVAIELLTRIGLGIYAYRDIQDSLSRLPLALLVGSIFDAMVFPYLALPVALAALLTPQRAQGSALDRGITSALFFVFTFSVLFSAVGEGFFWDEFQSRYNFIAVDYLVYTNEVIGNIRESYPVNRLIAGMAAISLLLSFAFYKRAKLPAAPTLPGRAIAFGLLVACCCISFATMQGRFAEVSENRPLNELARNGIFELFSAFRNNELHYETFYATRPEAEVEEFLRSYSGADKDSSSPLLHTIKGKGGNKPNLVMITVKSLSAKFLQRFGNDQNITPNLDALIGKSLFFSDLYATGTRTVYGLSTLTLSIPPVPGNSIVRRPRNGNLFSIGSVLSQQGYKTQFIYGGFGYFDNMNAFFANNGYEIVDRNNMAKNEIRFANIWGVADDDLFRRVLKENDKSYQDGKPFFNMVMTTSNHRPFTFPEGKIDIPSHSGRKGGVKFTDFAIHEFLQEASKKPWFDNTVFVIVADHTASSAGKAELEPEKYHIPMRVYAPKLVKPGTVDWMASQIDVPPTILGLMGISYESKFYGKDLMKEKPDRAFISNYQQLGYMTKEGLVILQPVNKSSYYDRDGMTFTEVETVPADMLKTAIGFYQGAASWERWNRNEPIAPAQKH